MQATTATFLAGGIARSALSNDATWAALLATSESVTDIGRLLDRLDNC